MRADVESAGIMTVDPIFTPVNPTKPQGCRGRRVFAQANLLGPQLGCTVAQAPYIRRDRRYLIGGELSPTHGWHGRAILFGLRHASGYRFRYSTVATIAPQPFGVREIGTEGCARAASAMATRAGRSADLTVVDAIAQCHHLLRRSVRNGKTRRFSGSTGIRMSAFRRFGVRYTNVAGWGRCAWTRNEVRSAAPATRPRAVDDPVNPSAHIVGDVE
jgi:hypothetical protein